MAGLVVDAGLCVGCGRCVRACATAGIEVVDRQARPTDGCVLCGACVEACPVDALSIARDDATSAPAEDLSAWRGIWVVAELDRAGALVPVVRELTGRACELARAQSTSVTVLVPVTASPDDATRRAAAAQMAGELIAEGADEVRVCLDERFGAPDVALFARWVVDEVRAHRPEVLLIGATAWGRVLAPAISVRLETGLTADCTALDMDPATRLLEQTRPAFGGNLMATIACPVRRPQMATVRPGIFAPPAPDPARAGTVHLVEHLAADVRPRVAERAFEPAGTGAGITDADVLLVVGRGIGAKRNLAVFERLAALMGAAIGCTRPLVEAGWLEYPHQVGQTGVSVAPRLLVSFGVSGAIQHVAGIGGAKTIVAVNEDPRAPIFGVCHYQVVGDCVEVARQMIAQLEARA